MLDPYLIQFYSLVVGISALVITAGSKLYVWKKSQPNFLVEIQKKHITNIHAKDGNLKEISIFTQLYIRNLSLKSNSTKTVEFTFENSRTAYKQAMCLTIPGKTRKFIDLYPMRGFVVSDNPLKTHYKLKIELIDQYDNSFHSYCSLAVSQRCPNK